MSDAKVSVSEGSGVDIDNEAVTTGVGAVKRQRVRPGGLGPTELQDFRAGNPALSDVGGVVKDPWNVPASAAAVTTVPVGTSTVLLLAANASRKSATVFNDSLLAALMVKEGTTAGLDDFSHYVPPRGSVPIVGYTGRLDGIWDVVDAAGKARITERS